MPEDKGFCPSHVMSRKHPEDILLKINYLINDSSGKGKEITMEIVFNFNAHENFRIYDFLKGTSSIDGYFFF